jgi:hypothetical protein
VKPTLIRVASSPQALLNGVAVSPEGRVFSSFPRWTDVPTPSLAEAKEGGFVPFPGGGWNEWRPGDPVQEKFVSVHSSSADAENRLWVVDDAAPQHGARIAGGQKLVCIDLATNKVTRLYPMSDDLAPEGSVLGHVRVAGGFAYLTELRLGAIIVIDLASGTGRRVLSGHPKTRADPRLVPVVEGKDLRLAATGKPPSVQVDLVALSPDATWLYFMTLYGPMLYRIETRHLRDASLGNDEIGAHIEDVAQVPPCAGVAADRRGRLYLSSFTQDAILTLGPDGKLATLVSDPRISFPNEGAVGPDGYFYFPASQIHRSAAFQEDHVARVQLPFEIFKVKLPD